MAAHNVVRILGTLPGGEVWSVTPKFTPYFGEPVVTYEALLEWAEGIRDWFLTPGMAPSLRNSMSGAARVTGIRTEYVGEDFRLAQAAEVTFPSPISGAAVATKPFQTAIVLSLRTSRPGRSARGRLYWPALGINISESTLRVPPIVLTEMLEDFEEMLKAIEAAAPDDTPVALAVVSQTTGSNLVVRELQIGDVLDTQRRRRDAAIEAYTSLSYRPV